MSTRLILTLSASAAILSACATNQENPYYKYSSKHQGQAQTVQVASTPQAASVDVTPVRYEASGVNGQESTSQTGSPLAERRYTIITESDSGREVIRTSTTTSANATRIVNQCVMSSGVETCQPVIIPVSSALAAPTKTVQNGYLINASSTQTDGRLTQVESECVQDGAAVPCYPVEIPITTDATVSQPYYDQPEIIMANSGAATTSAPTDSHYGGTLNGTPGYYAVHGTPDAEVSPNPQTESYVFTQVETTTSAPTIVNAKAQPSNHLFADSYISGDGGMLHSITEGDTVYSLARKTCTSVAEIRSINGLNTDAYIRVGDNIRLPASRC